MNSLTKEQQKLYQNAKICYVYKEMFEDKYAEDKKYRKVRDHCHYKKKYRRAADSMFYLKYSIPKEIPKVSDNGSNYGYHFMMKVLAKKKNLLALEETLISALPFHFEYQN